MAFAQPTELKGAEVHIPDPIVNFLKSDIFADADV
jgi:hypothetical protein